MNSTRVYYIGLVFCVAIIGVLGCTFERVIEPFPKKNLAAGWSYSDTLVFTDINWKENENLKLRISISDTFEFENIYLKGSFWQTRDTVVSKVFSIQLADKFGNWLGKCPSSICTLDYDLTQASILPEQDKLSISISQWTRDSILTGVSGLQLVCSKKD